MEDATDANHEHTLRFPLAHVLQGLKSGTLFELPLFEAPLSWYGAHKTPYSRHN